jgi:membrane-associated protein
MDDATTQLRRITPDDQPPHHQQQPQQPYGNHNGYNDQQYYGQYPQAPGYGQQQPYGTQQGGGQPPSTGVTDRRLAAADGQEARSPGVKGQRAEGR